MGQKNYRYTVERKRTHREQDSCGLGKVFSNKEINVYSLILTTGWSTEPESVNNLESEPSRRQRMETLTFVHLLKYVCLLQSKMIGGR